MKKLRLGEDREYGTLQCGFGLNDPLCDKAATWHLLLDDMHTLLACDEHLRYIDSRQNTVVDRHVIGGLCNMPGVVWQTSTPETEGFCTFPIPDGLEVEESQLAEVSS